MASAAGRRTPVRQQKSPSKASYDVTEGLSLEKIYQRRYLRTEEQILLKDGDFTDNPRGHPHKGEECMKRIAAVGFDPSCDMLVYETPGKA